MKNLLFPLTFILCFSASPQGVADLLTSRKKKQAVKEEKFEELMTEISTLYTQGRFRSHLMRDAAIIHPENVKLNKIQAIYFLEELKDPWKALSHLNLVLDSLPGDSLFTEKRAKATINLITTKRETAEMCDLLINDVMVLKNQYGVRRKTMDGLEEWAEKRKKIILNREK